jgi:hypothetical protein
MDGQAWQRLCIQVLHQHYPEDLIPVPDKARGDAGLEAYTVEGLAYQCYSPDEPLSVGQRYAKHRAKMTTDVGKFIENGDRLKPMFGPVKIRRWILLVPIYDSRDIVIHATRQTERIRSAMLCYADKEIFVLVQTLDFYQISLDMVVNARLSRLYLPSLLSAPDYTSVHTDLVDTMQAKLAKVPKLANDQRRRAYSQSLLTAHLKGRVHRDYIRDHYSELGDELDHLLSDLEDRLDTEFTLVNDPPEQMLLQVKAYAEERVRRALPHVRDADARVIAEVRSQTG